MPVVYYDSVNYSIVGINDKVYCYSYRKPIAVWIKGEQKIRLLKVKQETQTNKKHCAVFAEWVRNEIMEEIRQI